jgi:hypothetical protein
VGKYLFKLGKGGHLILLGMGSILDISGTHPFLNRYEDMPVSTIAADFDKVGGDIAYILGHEDLLNNALPPSSEKQLELAIH